LHACSDTFSGKRVSPQGGDSQTGGLGQTQHSAQA
jgi:hypothetical protein